MGSTGKQEQRGAVLLDNFSLEGGFWAVSPERPPPKEIDASFPHSALELVFDLVCLSALVEALVIHERLLFVPQYSRGWHSMLDDRTLASLQWVLCPVELSDADLAAVDAAAKDRMGRAREPALGGLEVGATPRLERAIRTTAIRLAAGYGGRYAVQRESPESPWVKEPTRADGLGYARYQASQSHEEVLAGGAFFYETLSRMLQQPCVPHPLRAAYYAKAYLESTGRIESAASLAIEILEQAVGLSARSLRLRLNDPFFDLRVPAVLAAVLRECQSPSDVIPSALELRSSRSATAFREHLARYDEPVSRGNKKAILELMKEAQRYATDFSSALGAPSGTVSIQVGVVPVAVNVQVPVPASLADRLRPRRSHVAFLKLLYDSMMSVKNLSSEIGRIWAVDMDPAMGRLFTTAEGTRRQRTWRTEEY